MEHTSDFTTIRSVLLRDWEPIISNDLLPDDEYDSYIPAIIDLLKSDSSAEQLAGYLTNIERDYMEVETNPERTSLVAKNLVAAWKSRNPAL
jgi:hypothetical protein